MMLRGWLILWWSGCKSRTDRQEQAGEDAPASHPAFFLHQRKKAIRQDGLLLYLMPGSSLLSHGETPHYHRRYGVSLLSSAWGQVGPPRYGRQANSVLSTRPVLTCRFNLYQAYLSMSHPPKHLRRCKVKPHGSLVPVSSTHRCAYTPGLSTSSSSTFLQET